MEPALRWIGYGHLYSLAGYMLQDSGPIAKHTSAADETHCLPRYDTRTDLTSATS